MAKWNELDGGDLAGDAFASAWSEATQENVRTVTSAEMDRAGVFVVTADAEGPQRGWMKAISCI